MRRRGRQLLALALSLVLLAPVTASSVPRKSESQLRSELRALQAETASAGRAFDRAYWKLDEADVRLSRIERKLKTTREQLAVARKRLNRHAEAVYRHDEATYLDFLVGAASFEQLATRFDYLQRIGVADADAIREVIRLQDQLQQQRETLTLQRKDQLKALSALRRERDRLQTRLRTKQAAFKRVRAQLNLARGGTAGTYRPGPNGMVFPVTGSYYYANTWGASRSGGRRRHQGTDIMARRGTPVVAVSSGSVSSKTGGLGGRVIWLRGSNGWSFYYAHLDGWAVRSGHVSAGQVIGYVGATGNAAGGAPHLHFEIHPGGGGATNPYPYLRQME